MLSFGVYTEAAYALAIRDGKDLARVLTREWALAWGHYGTPRSIINDILECKWIAAAT